MLYSNWTLYNSKIHNFNQLKKQPTTQSAARQHDATSSNIIAHFWTKLSTLSAYLQPYHRSRPQLTISVQLNVGILLLIHNITLKSSQSKSVLSVVMPLWLPLRFFRRHACEQ